MQGEITRDISDKLRRKLTGEDEKRLAKRSTTNPDAYQFYLKGRYFAEKLSKEGLEKGIDYFHRAIDLDPNFALAYDGLAYAYATSDDFFLSPREAMPKAREAAKKALELDDTLPEAHTEMESLISGMNLTGVLPRGNSGARSSLNPTTPCSRVLRLVSSVGGAI